MSTTTKGGTQPDTPHVLGIKHMAFAVRDAEQALRSYVRFLNVPADTVIHDYQKSRNRVALFEIGGIEYQLCQSMDPGGRFDAWIRARGGEGLHHICYAVDDIAKALAHAQKHGAALRGCAGCGGVRGAHPHPEGYVAFLDDDAGGIEIEFMQVYTPEELERYRQVKGI
jgi:methylmalonyl-CoA/ethylmalonyl-CoA epimerase